MSHRLHVTNQVLIEVEARFGCERREPKRIRYNLIDGHGNFRRLF